MSVTWLGMVQAILAGVATGFATTHAGAPVSAGVLAGFMAGLSYIQIPHGAVPVASAAAQPQLPPVATS
jgi:phosphoribosylcarboxyaminoimidazole (NCAIR) mutase